MTAADSATVQAASAAFIVLLTLVLAVIAAKALGASNNQAKSAEAAIGAANRQAEASAQTVREMQKDRHLRAVPMLAITLNPLDTSQVNRILTVVCITNASDYPALNVRVTMSEAKDRYDPEELKLATPSPLPVIAPHEKVNLPTDMSRFTRAESPRTLRTDWVCIRVDFEGLLGAKVHLEWYWEPYEWEGGNEPVPGRGEKLLLSKVTGTSGADSTVADIDWQRAP